MSVLEQEIELPPVRDAGSFNNEEYERWNEQMRAKLEQEKS